MLLNFMGADVSTKTGICIMQVDTSTNLHTLLHVSEVTTAPIDGVHYTNLLRAISISEKVERLISSYGVHFCLIENFAFGNHYTLSMLTEITTLIKFKLYDYSIPFLTVAPTSLKKFITGNGKASKAQMAKMCEVKYNFKLENAKGKKIINDNMVDSYALAMLLVEVYTQGVKVNNVSRDAIDRLLEIGYYAGENISRG